MSSSGGGAGAGPIRQRLNAAEPEVVRGLPPPYGLRCSTTPKLPRFSLANCRRRPAVRSGASASPIAAATPWVDSASSSTDRVSASSRVRTWISRSAGKPRPARPGANRSLRRATQTIAPVVTSGRSNSPTKAAGAALVSSSSPAPVTSCQPPSGKPPPGKHPSMAGSPNGRTGVGVRVPASIAAIRPLRAARRASRDPAIPHSIVLLLF